MQIKAQCSDWRLPPPWLDDTLPELLALLQPLLRFLFQRSGVLDQLVERTYKHVVRVVRLYLVRWSGRGWRVGASIDSLLVMVPGCVLLLPLLPLGILLPVLAVLLVILSVVTLLSLVWSWGLVRGRALTVTSYHLAGYMLH